MATVLLRTGVNRTHVSAFCPHDSKINKTFFLNHSVVLVGLKLALSEGTRLLGMKDRTNFGRPRFRFKVKCAGSGQQALAPSPYIPNMKDPMRISPPVIDFDFRNSFSYSTVQ